MRRISNGGYLLATLLVTRFFLHSVSAPQSRSRAQASAAPAAFHRLPIFSLSFALARHSPTLQSIKNLCALLSRLVQGRANTHVGFCGCLQRGLPHPQSGGKDLVKSVHCLRAQRQNKRSGALGIAQGCRKTNAMGALAARCKVL
jgi:hypothetical protein